MATITAQALDASLDEKAVAHLNSASLNGWIAYTIYDDVIDNQPVPELISVANFALRQTEDHFHLALPGDSSFKDFVARALIIVDAANAWESTHARANVSKNVIIISTLPDYADYDQLAARSWGHVLAASGCLLIAGYKLSSPEQASLRLFFRHYLIARQLNDDAHDWEEDLRNSQLSPAVCLLLRDPKTLNLDTDIDDLRLQFWESTIDLLVQLINDHIAKARTALLDCPFKDRSVYDSWLDTLQQSADAAITERADSRAFIAAYSGN